MSEPDQNILYIESFGHPPEAIKPQDQVQA